MPSPLEADRAERLRRYDADMAEQLAPHLDATAIGDCQLCDEHGYRGGSVCTHVDYAPAAKRGIAACREALRKGKSCR